MGLCLGAQVSKPEERRVHITGEAGPIRQKDILVPLCSYFFGSMFLVVPFLKLGSDIKLSWPLVVVTERARQVTRIF